ncbi:hypothetical protein [Kitasatospora cineracea]|uniref:hypothetical protein n=1 Tax=Kitasatospora cineracea TaxID=88074 RepID=UPI0038210DD4
MDQHQVQSGGHPLQFNIDPGEQHVFDRIESHAKVIPQRNAPAFTSTTWTVTIFQADPFLTDRHPQQGLSHGTRSAEARARAAIRSGSMSG